jgi:hypothetical protein
MYTAADVKVVSSKHVQGYNHAGQAEQQVQVTYMVGTHGPFMENFPAAGFDPNTAKQKMIDFAIKIGQLVG